MGLLLVALAHFYMRPRMLQSALSLLAFAHLHTPQNDAVNSGDWHTDRLKFCT